MGNTNNIVEVNGRRYDTVSGAVVASNAHQKSATAVHTRQHQASSRTIDGVVRVSRDHAATKPASHAYKTKSSVRSAHTPATHAKAHKPQRATTLMRSVVKKPATGAATSSSAFKTNSRTDIPAVRHAHPLTKKLSYDKIDHDRHTRSQSVNKHPVVSHFGKHPSTTSVKYTPVETSAPAHNAARVVPLPQPSSRSSEIFEKALISAKSHEQVFEDIGRPRAKRRKRAASFAGVSLAILLLIGVVSYTNAPRISLSVASYRSGLQAKLPTYNPGDFSFTNLDYKPGTVTANFASASGDETYKVSQRASNWDSQALLTNVVSADKSGYKTYQRAGRTVYIMSNNSATWVDSGILYTIEGTARFSATQLLDLASSM